MNKQLRERLKIPANPLKLSEAQIQRAVFAELRLREREYPQLRYVIHVPNEGKRSTIGGKLAKDGGLTPGALDMIALTGNRWALELKANDNVPTPAQSWWMLQLINAPDGGLIGLAYSIDEAVDFVLDRYRLKHRPAPIALWRAGEWLNYLHEIGHVFDDPRQADADKSRAW